MYKNTIRALSFFTVLIALYSCDSPTSDTQSEDSIEIVIFQNVDTENLEKEVQNFANNYNIEESQVRFRYEHKLQGISAVLKSSQVNSLAQQTKGGECPCIVPGRFITVFTYPPNFTDWNRETRSQWSEEKIDFIQEEYHITDQQIIHRYTVVTPGFAANLDDEQLFELDNEDLIRHIAPDVRGPALQ